MTKFRCEKCNSPISVRDYSCPVCGELTNMDIKVRVNPIALILALIVPPLGVVLYLLNNNATPTRGKKYAIAAAIGLVIYICFLITIKVLVRSYLVEEIISFAKLLVSSFMA